MTPDPYRKGGPHDDVANNIRQEQNRDAMPSKEEMQADHRRMLSAEGCKICGEDDPDVLHAVHPWAHPCPGIQNPPGDPVVYCDEHLDQRPTLAAWKVRQTKVAMRNDETEALVWYECGMCADAAYPTADGAPIRYSTPSAAVRCPRCNAPLDYVDYLEYEEADQ